MKFTKLTRLRIGKLTEGQEICEEGISFKRLRNGDGLYTINIMVDGQRIHRVVGRESTGTTRTHAEEFIQKVRRDARDNRLSLPKGRKNALSFEDAAKKYLRKLEEENGSDLKMKAKRIQLHLIPFFGSSPLLKITSFDIERYKKSRINQPVLKGRNLPDSKEKQLTKKSTVNRELATLSHIFNKAIEWGWIDRKPATIKRFKEDRGRITYLTTSQIERLKEEAKKDQNYQIYPFIFIGLETSMRLMEILSIRKENIDLEKRIIFIPKAKAGSREQPITKSLCDFLKEYLDSNYTNHSPWLFPSEGSKTGHTIDVRKAYRRVVKAANLNPDEVLRHTLRHTAITHLVQAGVDLPTVKRISGHKTLTMVERYAHQNGEHIQVAMDKLEERYKKAI